MDRLNIDEARAEQFIAEYQQNDPDREQPLPGSRLKLRDDVMWYEFAGMRIIWGHAQPGVVTVYSPDIFGDITFGVEAKYITDRAPVDPHDLPAMPLFDELEPEPQQQQQAQDEGDHGRQQSGKAGSHKTGDVRQAIKRILDQLPKEAQKAAREKIRALRPELLVGADR